MSVLGQSRTFRTPLRYVWNAAMNRHSGPNIGNAPITATIIVWHCGLHQPIARCADYRSEIISGDIVARYARGREEQADFYADEIVTIADTEPDAAIARVRIDARK